jgi:hypothetical protein
MIRLGALFWLLLVVSAGFVTFKVKYAVQDIEDELNRVRKQTVSEQQEIRVLTAEWTYLNQPERLAELNRRFVQLAPIGAKQLQQKIDEIPLRPAPPPSAPPDVLVASTTDPVVTQTAANAAPIGETAPAAPAPPRGLSALPAFAISQAAASELPVAPVGLKPATAKPAAPVQLAKAGPAQQPRSLDELFSLVAETR